LLTANRRIAMALGLSVLLVVVLAACAGGPAPAANAPESLAGAWTMDGGDAPVHLMLMPDGEFRVADEIDLLFDSPRLLGQYTYNEGRVVFQNGGYSSEACRAPGGYVVTTYTAGSNSAFTLTVEDDDCEVRRVLFDGHQWGQSEPAG
jgi:hypothetical protein